MGAMTVRTRVPLVFDSTMWIQIDKEGLVRFSPECIDESVEFNENGTAQVSSDVGETLIEQFDSITEKTE